MKEVKEKHGGGVRMEGFDVEEAGRMVAIFESVGATRFDVTLTDLDGNKQGFRSGQGSDALARLIPSILQNAARSHHNVIVRPSGGDISFIQLDDLAASGIERAREAAFLILATSPGNHQAWLAVKGCDADFARRVRKASGADASASGATRVAGTVNFKRKYDPDFPTIRTLAAIPARIVSKDDLTRLGLVAPPEEKPKPPAAPRRVSPKWQGKAWPSYERCVQFAPPNQSGTAPDVSRADFVWCMTAIDWGWGIEQTATKLMEKSTKAKENGERYAILTAQNAGAAVAQRRTTKNS